MSATVAQYPVEPHAARARLLDDVSAAKKHMHAHVRAATAVVAPATTPLQPVRAHKASARAAEPVAADPAAESASTVDSTTTTTTSSSSNSTNTTTTTNSSSARSERVALVLDMDECLVHSKFVNEVEYRQSEYRPSALQAYADSFEIEMEDGERAVVHKRPGLDRFLAEASRHFDVYVFTAGLEAYGKPILDALDPKGTLFAGRFFRESCQQRKGMFLKDLRVVRADLSRVILVDNNPVSFLLQPSNGIPVPSFYDDAGDRTLESLAKVLASLRDLADVRPRLHQLFRLADLLSEHQRLILS